MTELDHARNHQIQRMKRILLDKIEEDNAAKKKTLNYTNSTPQQKIYDGYVMYVPEFQPPPATVPTQVKLDTLNATGAGVSIEQKMNHSYLPSLIRSGLYLRN